MTSKNTDPKILTFPDEYDDSIPNVTLAEYVLDHIKQFGDSRACIHSETEAILTYNNIINLTKALAAGLQFKYNLKPTEAVAVALPNCLEYPVVTLAVNLCGGINILMNPNQTSAELQHSVSLSRPKLWIATEQFIPKFNDLYPEMAKRPPLILMSDKPGLLGLVTWADLIGIGKNKEVKIPKINAKEDIAFILFSSGTTGLPKGVSLTNSNYLTARRQNIELTKNIPSNPEDLGSVMLPIYHTFGISSTLDNIMRGLCYVLIPHFTFQKMLEAVEKYKITIMSVVPAIATQLVKRPVEKQYDLSSIRVLLSGAAALSKEISAQLVDKLGCFVFQAYGMTESTLRTHGNFISHSKEGSIGVVMPFCYSKIVDLNTNEALGPNQEGEICVTGPMVMKGYIGNEEATKSTIDSEGWLHTGDIGYYDEEGFFFITDRLKELIKYKGLQISPTELEQILLTHPDVMDVAVTSIPDESAGELPRAYVVKKSQAGVTEEELIKLVHDQVSSYKQLRGGLVFVKEIPKTPTGKIIRRELKKITSKL